MVKLKFIVRESVLVLRISEDQRRYYKRVGYLLKGKPNLEKHWKADKGCFSSYAVNYVENNKILDEYKEIYWRIIQEHPELSAKQVADYYKTENAYAMPATSVSEWLKEDYRNSVSKYLEVVINREKAKQGCNFEIYYKLLTKCRKTIPGFDGLAFSTIDYNKMVGIAYIFARGKGYKHMTKAFRAFLGKAHKDKDVNFDLSQIGDFIFGDYDPDKYTVVEKHPDVLSSEQLKRFLNMNVEYATPAYKDRKLVELYHDFCVFMFHSFFAPCDVIKVKLKDITNKNTILVKRKKTHRTVEVPITPVMKDIINKYKGRSKDGYIFPIMDDKKEKERGTKDYTYKIFRGKINKWLKLVGNDLGTDFNLYAYVFRHTAITVAVNNNLPISYIANAAGTSVEMIQEHYYNGECEQNRDMLTAAFMRACV